MFGSKKCNDKAQEELSLWKKKKDSLCKFFISQLAPDQNKDQDNSKQYLRLFTETLELTLTTKCKTLIEEKLKEKEEIFSRLKLQESHDLSITGLTKDELLKFVLKPTESLVDAFETLWTDFEASMNNIVRIKFNESLDIFDRLKESLSRLNDSISNLKTSSESFNANEIFQLKQERLDVDINNIIHLKGLCASDLIFKLLCYNELETNFNPETSLLGGFFSTGTCLFSLFKCLSINFN